MMTTGEFGRWLGDRRRLGEPISGETVRRYIARGLPTAGSTGRGVLIDPEAGLAWIRQHVHRAKRHGGKRRGAGRKAKTSRDPEAESMHARMRAAELLADVRTRAAPPPGAMRADEILRLTMEELRTLSVVAEDVGLSGPQLTIMRELVSIKLMEIKIREQERSVISIEDHERIVGELQSAVVSSLDMLAPGAAGAAYIAAVRDGGTVESVEAAIGAEVGAARDRIRQSVIRIADGARS